MSAQRQYAAHDCDIAPVAALIADPTRAAILTALLDGRPFAAGELAYLAGVSAATASAHLARLLHGGMVEVTKQGRHRYYRLAGPHIAAVIEAMAHVSPRPPVRSLRQSRQAAALQDARTCYDHLAGRAGVALLAALLDNKIITITVLNGCACWRCQGVRAEPGGLRAAEGSRGVVPPAQHAHDGAPAEEPGLAGSPVRAEFEVTQAGSHALAAFGISIPAVRQQRRRFAGACLDWTQRRPHLNGALGAAVLARLLDLGWFERGQTRRALRLTDAGRSGLADTFGCVIAG